MRHLILVLLLFCSSVFAQTPGKETLWVFVPEASSDQVKNYFDANSIEKYNKNGITYSIGTVLVVPKSPQEIKISNKKTIRATSTARLLIVDCDHALTTNMYDLYFSVKLPVRGTNPIGGMDYTKSSDYSEISRTSPLYLIMCPNQI